MVGKKVYLRELAVEIEKTLAEYSEEVSEDIKHEVKNVANETVQRLKKTSPKDSGEYAKGWAAKTEFESKEDIRIRVYNRKKPQITHVLENGHAKINGGRVEGKPHIGPAEKEAEEKLAGRAKVAVRG